MQTGDFYTKKMLPCKPEGALRLAGSLCRAWATLFNNTL